MKQRLISMLLSLPLAVSVIQAQPITAGQHTRVETVYGTIEGLPRWEPYNEETGVTMILDNKCEPHQHHDRELMQMSRSIW